MRPLRLAAWLLVVSIMLAGCTAGPFADAISTPGSAAKELVDPKLHPKLLVEIDHPPGYGPNAEALATLKATLEEVTARPPDRVIIEQQASIPAEAGKKYTYAEIRALEDEHRDHHTGGDTAVLYLMYVAGGSSEDGSDTRALGAAYRGTSLVIFKGNVKESTGSGGLLSTRPPEHCVERAVLVHEFGHAAGLVNIGTPMVRDHEDPEHKGHSSNKRSVMYWAVENGVDLLAMFTGGCSDIPYKFDADDLADLRALRDG